MQRRHMLGGLGAIAMSKPLSVRAAGVPGLDPALPDGTRDEAIMDSLPGKKPLIKLTFRPPNYETPVADLSSADHRQRQLLRALPSGRHPRHGEAARLVAENRRPARPSVRCRCRSTTSSVCRQSTLNAVCQCAGNRRGFSTPHVAGVEWGSGAMGDAVWARRAAARTCSRAAGVKAERRRDRLRRHGRADPADHAGVPQKPADGKSHWRRLHDRIQHERRRTLPLLNGYPGPPDRARLDRHLLDEAHLDDRTARHAVRELLDAESLPRAQRHVPARAPVHDAGGRRERADHRTCGEHADHQRRGRRASAGRRLHGARASPGTADTESTRSKSPSTAAPPGSRRRSATTTASTPSAASAWP